MPDLNRHNSAIFILCALLLVLCTATHADEPPTADYLRCEYRVDPLGIDIAAPRLSWEMRDTRRGAKQTAYQILVASSSEKLAADAADLWDSGKVAGDQSAQIVYEGKPLASRMRCYWKVRIWDQDGKPLAWSQPALWTMGLLTIDDFKSKWIGAEPLGATTQPTASPMPCPLLRKEFKVDQPIRRATLYASALGSYQIRLNGQRVGKDYFTPDWTDYQKRVYYYTYDVTNLVKTGPNAIGGILGAGWYAGAVCLVHEGKIYGQYPRLAAQLELELADGSRMIIATDESWHTTPGPILEGETLAGETYDATREVPAWDQPGLNDASWNPVRVTDQIEAKLQAFPGVTVQETGELKPVKQTEPKPGVYIFNLGQNFAGVARLKVKGPRGTRVVLRFGEWLNPDGTLYTDNLGDARATDTYVLKGDGEEIFQPQFTYHGFQYVELTNFPGAPDMETITGVVLGSAIPLVGKFECSNPMVNQIYSNIVWTQRANYFSVPTDCPQRDERMGWTGDAQVFVRAGTYNADTAAFFTKWLTDLEDDQRADGAFPSIAPMIMKMSDGGAAWADAGTICPWTIYQVYNDKRVLEKCYPGMVKWVERCRGLGRKTLLQPPRNHGDWLSIGSNTPEDVLGTAYFAHSTDLTARTAKILGQTDDAEKYAHLFEQIKAAFNKAYVKPDGRIKGNTQAVYVLALEFNLLSSANQKLAAKYLNDDIAAHDGRLTTGFIGTGLLLPALTLADHTPTAYELLLSEKFPSWGFCVKQGATTMWENWDGWTPDKGFQDRRANSLSHYSFGAVGQWMFQDMAGIDTAEPGFQKLLIHPEPGPGIDWIKTSYHSLHGTISSAWKKEDGKLNIQLTIPANTSATIQIPGQIAQDDLDRLTKKTDSPGHIEANRAVLENVPAGSYEFEVPWKDQ